VLPSHCFPTGELLTKGDGAESEMNWRRGRGGDRGQEGGVVVRSGVRDVGKEERGRGKLKPGGDRGTEGQRDGGTEGRRDGGMEGQRGGSEKRAWWWRWTLGCLRWLKVG